MYFPSTSTLFQLVIWILSAHASSLTPSLISFEICIKYVQCSALVLAETYVGYILELTILSQFPRFLVSPSNMQIYVFFNFCKVFVGYSFKVWQMIVWAFQSLRTLTIILLYLLFYINFLFAIYIYFFTSCFFYCLCIHFSLGTV